MKTKKKVSIIIPAYNEELSIQKVVRDILRQRLGCEIIVVDDGSTDNTAVLARKAGAKIIKNQSNHGYGAALKKGIAVSSGEYLLFCDADGQHSADDVQNIISQFDECDMLVGNRNDQSYSHPLRLPGKFFLRTFSNMLAGKKIPDLNSGLRMIKKNIMLKYIHLMPNGFSFSTTCTMTMLKTNHYIKWIPITVKKPKGKSTVRQWKHGPQTFLLILKLIVLFEPLKIFFTIDFFLFILTLLSIIIDYFYSENFGISDTTIIFSIATIIVFLFGLLCDQISSLRREIHE